MSGRGGRLGELAGSRAKTGRKQDGRCRKGESDNPRLSAGDTQQQHDDGCAGPLSDEAIMRTVIGQGIDPHQYARCSGFLHRSRDMNAPVFDLFLCSFHLLFRKTMCVIALKFMEFSKMPCIWPVFTGDQVGKRQRNKPDGKKNRIKICFSILCGSAQ